jgi:hypothetical protein
MLFYVLASGMLITTVFRAHPVSAYFGSSWDSAPDPEILRVEPIA